MNQGGTVKIVSAVHKKSRKEKQGMGTRGIKQNSKNIKYMC